VAFRLSHSSSPGAKIHGAHWSNFARGEISSPGRKFMELTRVISPGAKYPRPGENLLAWSELRARISAPSCHSGLYSPRVSYG